MRWYFQSFYKERGGNKGFHFAKSEGFDVLSENLINLSKFWFQFFQEYIVFY